jgi:hypothetical protein
MALVVRLSEGWADLVLNIDGLRADSSSVVYGIKRRLTRRRRDRGRSCRAAASPLREYYTRSCLCFLGINLHLNLPSALDPNLNFNAYADVVMQTGVMRT